MTLAAARVELFLSRRKGVRKSGSQWIARCPAHDDRSPSMWVKEGDDGRVLFGCRAMCDKAGILGELGLEWPDLFSDSSPRSQPFKPTPKRRSSDARPPQRDEIEFDWDYGSTRLDAYQTSLHRWSQSFFTRSHVEFDQWGEVVRYELL